MRVALAALGLAAAVFLVFGRVAGHEFVAYDTRPYLTENPWVLRGLSLEGTAWAFTTVHAANWHPLTWLSLMLDVELFGARPGYFALENVAWHAANAALLLAALVRMTGAFGRSLFVAALFALHPLHVESVAWVVERKDLLSAFFAVRLPARVGALDAPRAPVGPPPGDRVPGARPPGEADARHVAVRAPAPRSLAAPPDAPRRAAPLPREAAALRARRGLGGRDARRAARGRRGAGPREPAARRAPRERGAGVRGLPGEGALAGAPRLLLPARRGPAAVARVDRRRARGAGARRGDRLGLAGAARGAVRARRLALLPRHSRAGDRPRAGRRPGAGGPLHLPAADGHLRDRRVGRLRPRRARVRSCGRRSRGSGRSSSPR
jgi:hypothetical protein